jgi:hypothetical protein
VNALDASYLAGFFDGDGSLHFQLVRQKEYRFGFYARASLSFSQSTSARAGLEQLQRLVGGGYLRDRGTGMSDLVITSRPLVTNLLIKMEPYVRFKEVHVREGLKLLTMIRPRMNQEEFLQVADAIDAFSSLNYSKTKRISAKDVRAFLNSKGVCAPVSTSLQSQGDADPLPIGKSKDRIRRRPLERG